LFIEELRVPATLAGSNCGVVKFTWWTGQARVGIGIVELAIAAEHAVSYAKEGTRVRTNAAQPTGAVEGVSVPRRLVRDALKRVRVDALVDVALLASTRRLVVKLQLPAR